MSTTKESKPKKTPALLRWLLLAAAATVILAVLAGRAGSPDGETENPGRDTAEISGIPVEVGRPVRGTLEKTYTSSAFIESRNLVGVTPKLQGTLLSLEVETGDRVEKGAELARIDDSAVRLNLRQAEAAYEAASSAYNRTRELYRENAASRQNYDQALSQYQATEAQLELARLNADYARVTAPLSGTVIQVPVSEGSVVSPQTVIVMIADLEDFSVKARIPEQYFPLFRSQGASTPVTVRVPAAGEARVEGRIRTVTPYVSPSSRSFDVLVDLSGAVEALRPGMFAELAFVLERHTGVLSLPFEALDDQGRLWYVREDGTASFQTGAAGFSNDSRFEVDDSWESRQVILQGQRFLSDGQKVHITGNGEVLP